MTSLINGGVSEIDRLRDRVAELEDALGLTAAVPDHLLPEWYIRRHHIQRRTLEIIGILLARPFASKIALFDILYGARPYIDHPTPKNIDIFVCRARTALRPLSVEITSVWGKGWYLDAANKTKLRGVIARLNAERVAA